MMDYTVYLDHDGDLWVAFGGLLHYVEQMPSSAPVVQGGTEFNVVNRAYGPLTLAAAPVAN